MINSPERPRVSDGEVFFFCRREKGKLWLEWLLWCMDVETWSQLRRGSFECSLPSAVAEGKAKLYHHELWECPQAATVKQQGNMQRPIGRHIRTWPVTQMMIPRSGIPPAGRRAGRATTEHRFQPGSPPCTAASLLTYVVTGTKGILPSPKVRRCAKLSVLE